MSSGLNLVEEYLRDEVWDTPSKLASLIYNTMSEADVYALAGMAITFAQYPRLGEKPAMFREHCEKEFERVFALYKDAHWSRAEKAVMEMQQAAADDALADLRETQEP